MADPVDAATGSLYIPAVDMRLPGLDGDFTVSRRYESVNPRAGLLGQGWTCSAESFLQYKGDACSVLCADGHVEGFHKKDGAWRNDKGGSGKISLAYDAGQNLFVMHDIVTHMSYFYGEGAGSSAWRTARDTARSICTRTVSCAGLPPLRGSASASASRTGGSGACGRARTHSALRI